MKLVLPFLLAVGGGGRGKGKRLGEMFQHSHKEEMKKSCGPESRLTLQKNRKSSGSQVKIGEKNLG